MKKRIVFAVIAALTIMTCAAAFSTTAGTREGPQDAPTAAPVAANVERVDKDTTQAETPVMDAPDAVLADTEPEVEWIEVTATAYCPCELCCGVWAEDRPDGIVYTASGAVAQEGVTIAADWSVFPPGTVVYIEGIGERTVQDRGAAVKGYAVDVYFEDHDEALEFGRQTVRLYVVENKE